MTDLINTSPKDIISSQVTAISSILNQLGFPSDNIVAEVDQREIINKNLLDYIMSLPDDVKRDARYLSKFVVGAGFGLFDYALNSVWNEVVIALRKKAIAYGIEIFF